jgi:hypothetical protein
LAIHAVFVQLDAQCLDSTRTHAPELQPFRRTGEEDDQGDERLENCRATSHPQATFIKHLANLANLAFFAFAADMAASLFALESKGLCLQSRYKVFG